MNHNYSSLSHFNQTSQIIFSLMRPWELVGSLPTLYSLLRLVLPCFQEGVAGLGSPKWGEGDLICLAPPPHLVVGSQILLIPALHSMWGVLPPT